MVFEGEVDLAKELLEEFGETAVLKQRTPGAPPDPTRRWKKGATVTVSTDASTAFFDATVARQLGFTIEDKQQIAFMNAKDLGTKIPRPTVDTVARASGAEFAIVKVDTLSPNGELILHTLTLQG